MKLVLAPLLAASACAFSVVPCNARPRAAPAAPRRFVALRAEPDAPSEKPWTEKFGYFQFVVPLGFAAQICFLVAVDRVVGQDALGEYGRMGNDYIQANTDFKNMPRTEIMRIQSAGQQIWWNNVVRSLENGGPKSPPLAEPYPKYVWGQDT